MAEQKITKDAVKILHNRYIKGKPNRLKSLQAERQKNYIAAEIYRLRTKAGLSQKQLADKIGTTQSVISRLEEADYSGYSLTKLRKIANALNCRIEVNFVPDTTRKRHYARMA